MEETDATGPLAEARELAHAHELATGGDESPLFQACPTRPGCVHCGSGATAADAGRGAWSFLDGVYCISLQHRDDRAREAADELHRIGLCRRAVFLRPPLDSKPKRGCWESHRVVAFHARARNLRRVLILEDDVLFSPSLDESTVARIAAAVTRLPDDWMGFYLGHWALWAYPVDRDVVRCSSLCTHAYLASERLLEWLCETPFEKKGLLRRSRVGGSGIDAVFSCLPGMYALSPLVAVQRLSPNDHLSAPRVRLRPLKYLVVDIVVRLRLREYALAYAMGWNERLILALTRLWPRRPDRRDGRGSETAIPGSEKDS